ncbi:hypothetical protein TRICI_004572 [Trichomonascus ciferrii]|uniref:DUF2415 domain-containing protein n=1 Tax=Trichomonascus ciferrii TaxID=44093 RepID=A0A642V6W2_9ASCO|nr:hypothetical protein TRICI_004572 [Trichomonascus ciferrii]
MDLIGYGVSGQEELVRPGGGTDEVDDDSYFYYYYNEEDDIGLYDESTTTVADGLLAYPDTYNLMRDFISDLEFEEYEQDSDFVSFLCTNGIMEDPTTMAMRVQRPAEITPRDLVAMDKQGVPIIEASPTYEHLRKRRYEAFVRPNRVERLDTSCTRMFDFSATYTSPTPTLAHFQLRNLMCPVSKNDIYVTQRGGTVARLDPEIKSSSCILSEMDTRQMRISTLAASDRVVVAGGFHGQYSLRTLDSDTVHYGHLTHCANGITNHIFIDSTTNNITYASNDCYVRTMDLQQSAPRVVAAARFPWPINCTAACPSAPHLQLLVGDTATALVRDTRTSHKTATMTTLHGHSDFGFACAWSPGDENIVATGNQDGTVRIFDLRQPCQALQVIGANLGGAVRSLSFDSSGRFLAFAEPIDYVTVLDMHDSLLERRQLIELWGDIVGLGFTDGPAGSARSLTIGSADQTVGGVIQYDHINHDPFLDQDNWW